MRMKTKHRSPGRRLPAGFTLIELIVSVLVFAILFIGLLQMLDSSSQISKVESALADTQENVRYVAYNLVRTARMVGGTNLPLGRDPGSFQWVSMQILDAQSTAFNDGFGSSHNVMDDSDVLVLRGFFEHTPYFVIPANVSTGSGTVAVLETPATPGQPLQDLVVPGQNKGIVFMGRNQYSVATVAAGSAIAGTAPTRTLTINFTGGAGDLWESLNPGGTYTAPSFQVYRVGILDEYDYYVRPDGQLNRWRAGPAGGADEPVALNIGSLQVAMGMDADRNGAIAANEWYYTQANPSPPTGAEVVGNPVSSPMTVLRITVLGRTPFPVPKWVEPTTTFQVENMTTPGAAARRAKWRTLQVRAALRDFVL